MSTLDYLIVPLVNRNLKMQSLAEQLRKAIADSGLSVYRIAKDSGIPQPTLQRFAAGGRETLRLDTADKLARYFQMRFTSPRFPKE